MFGWVLGANDDRVYKIISMREWYDEIIVLRDYSNILLTWWVLPLIPYDSDGWIVE